ncbi:MAG: hypothetical protein NW216_03610 [Hyphomicrobium sp.]|nr:hypothetical protein [Hyphomicrobium sp.]
MRRAMVGSGTTRSVVAAGSLAFSLSFGMSAEAAVRVCTEPVSSPVTKMPTEREARKAALSSWVDAAKAAGIEHPAWRIAADKVFVCLPVTDGFECVARARACTIKNAPPGSRQTGPRREI